METLEPGRDLDELIAKEVAGLEKVSLRLVQTDCDYRGHWEEILAHQVAGCYDEEVPNYSEDIAAIWAVAERRFFRFSLTRSEMPNQWFAEIVFHLGMGDFETYRSQSLISASHALCLACLKAARRKEPISY